VMNDQRKVIFEHRIDIMGRDDVSETVTDMRQQVVQELVAECIPPNAYAEQWNTTELKDEIGRIFGLDLPIDAWAAEEGIADQEISERLLKEIDGKVKAKEAEFGPETMRQIEKMVLLQTLDHLWREHLVTLEHLRQVIHFRGYGQRDPLNEYKSEGFHLFEAMLANLREAVTGQLMHIRGMPEEDDQPLMEPVELPPMQAHHIDPFTGQDELAMADAALAAASRPEVAERRAPLQSRRAAGALNPNDPATWGKISRNVTAFLTAVWRSGALFGTTPQEAFFVKCDAETNPPDVIEAGQVVVEIGIAPVKPAEFVIFRISQFTAGQSEVTA